MMEDETKRKGKEEKQLKLTLTERRTEKIKKRNWKSKKKTTHNHRKQEGEK